MTLIHIHSSGHSPAYHVNVPNEMVKALRKATEKGHTLSETEEGGILLKILHTRRDLQKVSGPPSFCEYM